MRATAFLLALGLAGAAHAQTTAPAPTPAPATPPAPASTTTPAPTAPSATHHTRRTFAERFAAANTTNDGKLTLEQARAGHMRAIARDFDKIDTAHHGYVTMDDIRAYRANQRAARRAARQHTTQPQ